MKTLLIVIVVLAAAFYFWNHGGERNLDRLTKRDPAGPAKARVEMMLTGMEHDGGGNGTEIQTSICEWDRGALLIKDRDELERALDAFNGWCGQKNLYNRRIGPWQVLDSKCDESGRECIVTARIEGTTYRMKVPERGRISWAP